MFLLRLLLGLTENDLMLKLKWVEMMSGLACLTMLIFAGDSKPPRCISDITGENEKLNHGRPS